MNSRSVTCSYRCHNDTPFRTTASRRCTVIAQSSREPGSQPPCLSAQQQQQQQQPGAPHALRAAAARAGHLAATLSLSAAFTLGGLPALAPLTVGPSGGLPVLQQLLHGPPAANAITNEQLLYLEAWRAVDRAYYDKQFNGSNWFKVREDALKKEPMGSREQTYEAIRRMLARLDDPFTRLLEPGRYAALKRGTGGGAITGVGLEVAFRDDKGADSELVVVTPAPGGPADRAGVRPGDVIAAIDGRPTAGISLYEAADLLQGAEGTQITLQLRKGPRLEDLQVSRARIPILPVAYKLCGDGDKTAYLRVATFSRSTAENTREAIKALQAEGASRYVLDLRNNGGGYFPGAIDVARMWVDRGDVVLVADNQGVRDIYDATGEAIESKAPLSVLINQGTGSAAEVLAGALKDNKRAVLAGETTFGKGLIQTVVELSDGSALTVTVARYQTPSGADINKKGIAPDLPQGTATLPFDPPGVCKVLEAPGAPSLFR